MFVDMLRSKENCQKIPKVIPKQLVSNLRLVSELEWPENHTHKLPTKIMETETMRFTEDPSQPRDIQQQLPSINVRLVDKICDRKKETHKNTASKKMHSPNCEEKWNKLLQLWSNVDCLVQEQIAHAKEGPTQYNLKAGKARDGQKMMRTELKLLRTGQAECRLNTCQADRTGLLKIIARNLDKITTSNQQEDAKPPSPGHQEDKEVEMKIKEPKY